jgi:hypothetical protein
MALYRILLGAPRAGSFKKLKILALQIGSPVSCFQKLYREISLV